MKNFNLYLLIFLIYFLTTIVRVTPDSLVYRNMAASLADGNSTFWHIHFTDTLFNNFYEHPPLGILTMAIPFYIFGDTIVVDKLYGPSFGLLLAVLISSIVGLITKENKCNTLLFSL